MQGMFVLDAYRTIYMWQGRDVNKVKKNNTPKKVEEYVKNLKDRNPDNVQIVPLDPGNEPLIFTRFFPEWETEVTQSWFEEDEYTKKIKQKAAASEALVKQLS